MLKRLPTRPRTGHALLVPMILMSIGVLVAAAVSAPLTWDGALYLVHMLDRGEPLIAQNRIANEYLHKPAIWVMHLTESESVIRFAFSFVHVITPLVALGLSWWVVRRDRTHLIIWPMLGIGLALLPGQINFISEGIKAEQLMWPLLLSILLGVQFRTLPLIAILAFSIYHLHPVAAPILVACGLAGIALALFEKEARTRLLATGALLIAGGVYKFSGVTGSYEQSEMSWETQERQWENGAFGLPMFAVVASLIFAIGMLIQCFATRENARRIRNVQIIAAVSGIAALIIWAAQPSQWWEALEFRGPAFWITMILAGCLFLHRMLEQFKPPLAFEHFHTHLLVLSAGFCIVLTIQSIAWHRVVGDFQDQLSAAEGACIAREDLNGFPYTPLNLWSTNVLSFVHQGYKPTKISMTAAECHDAKTTGNVQTGSSSLNNPVRYDYSVLEPGLLLGTVCTWHHGDGWYQAEALIPDAWRWSGESGSLEITLDSASEVTLTGSLRTVETPNLVEILVNGEAVEHLTIDSGDEVQIERVTFALPAGTSEITFVSENDPTLLPSDERPLAISLWNPVIHPGDGSSRCLQEDIP